MFTYDRAYPPLFFCPVSAEDVQAFEDSVNDLIDEFLQLVKNRKVKPDPDVPLSTGITVGELCMHLVRTRIRKR